MMVSSADHNITILKSYDIEEGSPEDRAYFLSLDWVTSGQVMSIFGPLLLTVAKAFSGMGGEINPQPFHGDLPLDDLPEG
ncbi:hypothetical protein ACFCX4_06345 [Kitasatospora sp. NPDC056327]|uniref:hypothetical protein n=1 Tax=Kitasatospora sp. NPDC056327 TaxID=3345785 RepID=UPI0035D91310